MKATTALVLLLAIGTSAVAQQATTAVAQQAHAEEIADRTVPAPFDNIAPAPSALIRAATPEVPVPHKFFDRQQLLALYVHGGVRLADTIKTCRVLAHGGVEEWIPSQSCGGIAAWEAGSVGLVLGIGWLFHKHGNHRLERLTPWIGTSASTAGLTKSVFNIR